MRFLLAVSLSEAGAVAEAEAELRAVVAAQPANAHARVALAETLLAQGRFADAAAEAASVDPEAPCAAAAQRTELFALLTDGTSADARAAVALPDEERAVFAAWEAVRSGAGAPAALPAPAAAPVLIMLDALARLQAFDAFEALVAVLEAVAMPVARAPSGAGRAVPAPRIRGLGRRGVDRGVRAGRGRRAGPARAGRRGRRSRARRGRPGVRRRGRRAGRGLIGLKFSWRLPNPLTTSRARDGPDRFPGGTEDPMSFDVSPLAGSPYTAASVDRTHRSSESSQGSFASAIGSTDTPPIPSEVWDQVDAAARLAENLHAEGRAVRFDVHKLDGGVVASLVDDERRHAAPAAARRRRRRRGVSRTS